MPARWRRRHRAGEGHGGSAYRTLHFRMRVPIMLTERLERAMYAHGHADASRTRSTDPAGVTERYERRAELITLDGLQASRSRFGSLTLLLSHRLRDAAARGRRAYLRPAVSVEGWRDDGGRRITRPLFGGRLDGAGKGTSSRKRFVIEITDRG